MPVVSTGHITITDVNDGVGLVILQTAPGFTFVGGVATPAQQWIGFTVQRQGPISGTAVWYASNGATLVTDAGQVSALSMSLGLYGAEDGNTCFLSIEQVTGTDPITITCVVGEVSASAQVALFHKVTESGRITADNIGEAMDDAAVNTVQIASGAVTTTLVVTVPNSSFSYMGSYASNAWGVLIDIGPLAVDDRVVMMFVSQSSVGDKTATVFLEDSSGVVRATYTGDSFGYRPLICAFAVTVGHPTYRLRIMRGDGAPASVSVDHLLTVQVIKR